MVNLGLAYGSGLHLLAYTETGELYTWGYNTYSQLGNGTTTHALTPSLVGGALAGKVVVQVDSTMSQSCYIILIFKFCVFRLGVVIIIV